MSLVILPHLQNEEIEGGGAAVSLGPMAAAEVEHESLNTTVLGSFWT